MLDLTDLGLRVVPIDKILLHEGIDPLRVERMISSLNDQGVIKNPLILATHADSFILLDGATRTIALREMGIPHIVAQVVSYDDPNVCIGCWHHVIFNVGPSTLRAHIGEIQELTCAYCGMEELKHSLETRLALFGIISPDGECWAFRSDTELPKQVQLLNRVVNLYRGKAEVVRTTTLDLATLLDEYPDLSVIVAFPLFTPEDVTHFAQNDLKLPMGVTRHLISGRTLGLNVALDVLASDQTLEEKNSWLEDMVRDRIRRDNVRVYQEPTIVFDE